MPACVYTDRQAHVHTYTLEPSTVAKWDEELGLNMVKAQWVLVTAVNNALEDAATGG